MATKNSEVLVKTPEMLVQFDEQETALLISSTIAFVEGEDSSEDAVATFSRIIGLKPTYARYEMGRITFVETLQGQGLSQDAIDQRSSRFFKKLGIDKPSSDNPDSIRRAEAREKAKQEKRAKFEKLSVDELHERVKTLSAKPTLASLKEVTEVVKEIETRQKEFDKGNAEAKKELLDKVTEYLKNMSYDELHRFATYTLDWTL